MSNVQYQYSGTELGMFAQAVNWKRYFAKKIKPFISGDVLEVGAGTGNNTKLLNDGSLRSWLLLEPDIKHCSILKGMLTRNELPATCSLQEGFIVNIEKEKKFDTILYLDVLEHIDDDGAEIGFAAERLKEGGKLIVLSPAHQFLFSPFDKAIGHCRRYDKKAIRSAVNGRLREISINYYDSIGLMASLANKLLLRQSSPTNAQVHFWDKYMVSGSRIVDPLFFYRVGKTIIGVWTNNK